MKDERLVKTVMLGMVEGERTIIKRTGDDVHCRRLSNTKWRRIRGFAAHTGHEF